MSLNPPPSDSKATGGSRRSVLLMLALAVVFGLGMALVGFLAGRATAPSEAAAPPATVLVEVTAPPADEPAQVSGDAELPPAAVATTPAPTAAPTTEPVGETAAQDEPVLELTVTVVPEPTLVPEALPTDTPAAQPDDALPLENADFSTFYEVWEIIREGYDGPVPPNDDIIQSAISGSLETLGDANTRYVPPLVAERVREDMQGSVEGIGAFVRENEDGLFEIVRPIDGQPADLAGLKAGDVLIAVDGESVTDISFDEVILLVRGPQGTTVNLTILREGEAEPLEFSIVRTRFEVPVVESEMLPDEITGGTPIGYVRLTEFNRNAEERVVEALGQLLAQQPAGIVFDLRDNLGGYVDQSVAVADAFLPAGTVLFERNIRGLSETFTSDDGDAAEQIPLVVLVNAASASASEIVAGALQDRGRAVLVGETTFGKGSVQQIYTLSDGAELRVTFARWYTPDNHTIDGEGITPDIEVESPEDLGGVDDGQLRRAVEFLLTGQ